MRTFTNAFIAELLATEKTPIVFYEGEFASGWVRLWSGLGNLVWNAKTWLGSGHLGKISPITETGEIQSNGVACALSGIPQEFVQMALSESRQGKPGKIWVGFLADDGTVMVDPALFFWGRLDVPTLEDNGETSTITISYESRLRDFESAREFRYTDESQKIFYPDDRGFEYVAGLQEWSGIWGRR